MITLAASMFEVANVGTGAADIGETLFLVIGAVIASFVIYGLAKQRRNED